MNFPNKDTSHTCGIIQVNVAQSPHPMALYLPAAREDKSHEGHTYLEKKETCVSYLNKNKTGN